MDPTPDSNIGLYWLVGILAVFLLLLLLTRLACLFNDFSKELKYLNKEIGRTVGEERRYWKRKRRRLWLSLIPFVKY